MVRVWLAGRLLATLLALCLGACVSEGSSAYTPTSPQAREPVVDATLFVPPLIDRREDDNTSAGWLWVVPLVPFGWMDYSTPEEHLNLVSQYHWYRAGGHIGPAGGWPLYLALEIAREIRAARIFRAVTVTSNPSAPVGYRLVGVWIASHRSGTAGATAVARES